MTLHSLADARSLALHSEVASRLASDPGIVDRARRRVSTWLTDAGAHPYAEAWARLLALPTTELQRELESPSEMMITLRQASPFAGALDSKTRAQLLKRPELRPNEAR